MKTDAIRAVLQNGAWKADSDGYFYAAVNGPVLVEARVELAALSTEPTGKVVVSVEEMQELLNPIKLPKPSEVNRNVYISRILYRVERWLDAKIKEAGDGS
jgi:hypothetical protein